MPKPAALLAFLCVLAACGSDRADEPQTTGRESPPSGPSTALPADLTAPVVPPDPATMTPPADSNTTLPAATPEEAAPPPEP